jgi:predicted phosphodiesterase
VWEAAVRERWTPERAQVIVNTIDECRGDLDAALARLKIGRPAADSALWRHLNRRLSDVVAAAKYGQPRLVDPIPVPPPPAPVVYREEPIFNVPPPRLPSAEGVERRLIMADLHMPVHSVAAVSCALQIARVLQPHVTIIAGDLLNLNALSRHPDYAVARETFDSGVGTARAFLRALRRTIGGRILVLEGNHEKWAYDYEVLNPRHVGTFSVPIALGLKPRPDPEDPGVVLDIEWVPEERQPIVIGPVAYLHGTNGGEHFCKRYASDLGPRAGVRHVVMGHHHAFQHYSHKNGIVAWGCGHLADDRSEAFDYAKQPRGWETGVLLQDVTADGLVTTQKIPIIGGRALVAGRLVAAAA